MQASFPVQFPAGASPFQVGGNPLFKTAGNELIAAPPINSAAGVSPFNVIGATPTNSPLTVGDVIHQLPAEVVRKGALPEEQPLSLPPALLESTLRSGQAALPVFELYRVCPALFQAPISPQDPRMVALPSAKLPGLIAQAREGQDGASAPAAAPSPSPFSFDRPASHLGSPFLMSQPKAEPAAQQPPASPFSVGTSPIGSPFGMPHQPATPTPFTPAGSPFSLSGGPNGSPFSTSQQPAAPAPSTPAGSPFSLGSGTNGSPFSASQQPAAPARSKPAGSPFSLGSGPSGSPFSTSQQTEAPAPSPFAAAPSPFAPAPAENGSAPPPAMAQASISTLFTPAAQQRASAPMDVTTAPAMPFGSAFVSAMKEAPPQTESPAQSGFAPQPQTPAPNAFSPQAPSAAPGNATASSGMAKLGFAAVLAGYSVEELGFNPATLPAWITTSIHASVLHEQIASGNVVVELGLLIDGISDFGFRNTLSNAKRDFKIKLSQNEVFHSLTNMSAAPAAAATLSSPGPAASPARFSVQPNPQQQSGQNLQPLFAASSPPAPAETQAPTPMFAAALAPFTQSHAAAPSSPTSAFGTPQPAAGPAQFGFSPPAAAAEAPPPPAPAFSFPSSQPATASPAKPSQPLAGTFQSFGGSLSPFGAASAATQGASPPGTVKPFDPFASSSTGPLSGKGPAESGFSSAQLLGQVPTPQPPAPSFAPAPEVKPAPSLFATPARAPVSFHATPSFAPALEEIPSFSTPPAPAPQPASRGLFSSSSLNVPLFSEAAAPQPKPEPSFAPATHALFKVPAAQAAPPAAAPAKMAAVKHSFLGLSPLDTQTDQLLLRALLGTEEKLDAPRVVELLAQQPGLSACVCLHGSQVLSHADSSKADALEFQHQAPDIARQLRGLAPLIGIEGAETFTLNAGGRLLTFCFPGQSMLGVLHDHEPSTGMRDKITLIARELARMLD